MNNRLVSIGVKLLVPVFLCFVIFGATLMYTIILLTTSTSAESFKESVNQKDNLVYSLIDEQTLLLEKKARWFAEYAGGERIIASLLEGQGAMKTRLQTEFDDLAGALGMDGIALADREGYLLINSGNSGGARYVRTIVSYTDDKNCITRMYTLDNTLALISAIPVFENGILAGYGFIEYSLQSSTFVDSLQSLTQCEIDLYQGPLHRGSSSGLSPLSQSRAGWITPFTGSLTSDHDRMIDTVLGLGETYRGEYTVGGINYYGVHFPLKDGSGSRVGIVSMSLPMTAVEATVQLISRVVIPLLLGGITVLLVVFVILLRQIVIAPLKKTASVTAAVSENLSSKEADFTYEIPVKGRDEIGVITRSINGFISSLRGPMKQLKDAQSSLQAIGEDLGSRSEESVKANARIMDAAMAIRGQTENQGQSLERTTQVLANAASALGGLNDLIIEQNKAITASSASVEEMASTIDAVRSAVQDLTAQFNSLISVTETGKERQAAVDQQIQGIMKQSESLIGANRVIAQIAARTNLLAMNAAIEAAHAGDAGRGFAVVAEEIRSLAENSQVQSQTIKEELSGIAQSVKDSVSTSAASQESFQMVSSQINATDTFITKISTAMEAQQGASAQIREALDAINTAASRVQSTGTDMTSHMDDVKKEMEGLTGIVREIQQGINGMGDSAQEVNKAAEAVLELAKDTHRNIQIMEGTIGSFRA
ncbi:MAG: methyl-accepting chemotaxis protein [Treponema sp.]|jgi:methyl-accepting chemotaxis protein|nr:methyl-accepting chemotaxis protein [Treponema sp.]